MKPSASIPSGACARLRPLEPRLPGAGASILSGARALQSLAPALAALERDEQVRTDIDHAVERGYFSPEESDRLRGWFARYLTARSALLESIADLRPIARPGAAAGEFDEDLHRRAFLVAWAAACLLVRAARTFVDDVAAHTVIQRKLNEACPAHRIPRRQYTRIYRSLTDPHHAWQINEALHYADAHRAELDAFATDPDLAPAVAVLAECDQAVRIGVRRYLKARLRYRWHSWRRRRASAVQQALFALFEAAGRAIADVQYRGWGRGHRVGDDIILALAELLAPGDVIITRHDHAVSNLFLPGYWPHASLHVGRASDCADPGLAPGVARRWIEPRRVLEAKKDGVRFRPLAETLAVDAFAVIRPALDREHIARAIRRAIAHEGKLYNFDFDFFTDDRLVCTEVVYRAYDGIGPMRFELRKRAGRLTLSAEDLLDMALEGRGFEPLAIFGAPGCEEQLVTGPETVHLLRSSYRQDAANNT